MQKDSNIPKVSILIPSYNQEGIIEETLSSALSQTYDNIEVVVSDDASTDLTPQILLKWQQEYPEKLMVFLHDANVGITENHNRGLLKCSGEFVTFLDGDDIFLSDKIEKQLAFMLDNPECTLSYHDVDVFNSKTSKRMYLWSKRFGTRQGNMRDLLRFGNYLPAVGVMVRREDLPPGGYDKRIAVYSDWLLWFSVLQNGGGKICYLPEVHARYRRHSDNLTNTFQQKFIDQNLVLDIVKAQFSDLTSEVNIRRSELYFMRAVNDFFNGRYISMLRFMFASLKVSFPRVPWIRLLLREVKFFLVNRFFADSIIRSLTHD